MAWKGQRVSTRQKNLRFNSAFRKYCGLADLQHGGAIYLRPWQLPFRPDMGLRGTGDIAAWPVQIET